jgi:hypothetical protein
MISRCCCGEHAKSENSDKFTYQFSPRFGVQRGWGRCVGNTKELVDNLPRVKVSLNMFAFEGFSSPQTSNTLVSESLNFAIGVLGCHRWVWCKSGNWIMVIIRVIPTGRDHAYGIQAIARELQEEPSLLPRKRRFFTGVVVEKEHVGKESPRSAQSRVQNRFEAAEKINH